MGIGVEFSGRVKGGMVLDGHALDKLGHDGHYKPFFVPFSAEVSPENGLTRSDGKLVHSKFVH